MVEILVGMTLGDGCITRGSGSTHRLEIEHSVKQKEYLEHKVKILQEFFKVTFKQYNSRFVFAYTESSPLLTEVRELVYDKDGRKRVTEKILDKLTPKSLAFWFMDDGASSSRTPYLDISTMLFKEDCLLLQQFLKDRYKIENTKVYPYYRNCKEFKGRDERFAYLYFGKGARKQFVDLVQPYIFPCMLYKINRVLLQDTVRTTQRCVEVSRNV